LTPCWASSICFFAFSENRLTISGAVPMIGMISVSVWTGLMSSGARRQALPMTW
jgi:hypothetical protein